MTYEKTRRQAEELNAIRYQGIHGIAELNSLRAKRNYWRRLIAAHVIGNEDLRRSANTSLRTWCVTLATDLVDELERIESEEANSTGE